MLVLAIAGCASSIRVPELRLDDQKTYIYGFVSIKNGAADATKGAKLTHSTGRSVLLGPKGFYVIEVKPSQWSQFRSFQLRNSEAEYALPNLWLQAGPKGSKTYFGHVSIAVSPAPKEKPELEEWTWTVKSDWRSAQDEWKRHFKEDALRPFQSLARRTGPANVPTRRARPVGRQDVEIGF